MKRDNPGWRDPYGHWWIEVDDTESFGWWPATVPLRPIDLVIGTKGVLNGMGLRGRDATWYRDANHGMDAAHNFHPMLVETKTDDQLRADIRRFAHGYEGRWRWASSREDTRGTCRSFQDELFTAVGLAEGLEHLHTRGSGCPFLYYPRTVQWWIQDTLATFRKVPTRTRATQPDALPSVPANDCARN